MSSDQLVVFSCVETSLDFPFFFLQFWKCHGADSAMRGCVVVDEEYFFPDHPVAPSSMGCHYGPQFKSQNRQFSEKKWNRGLNILPGKEMKSYHHMFSVGLWTGRQSKSGPDDGGPW